MRVAELEVALLDYWVARANEIRGPFVRGAYNFIRSGGADVIYSPSRDWMSGGPIIERERMTLLDPKLCESGQWEAFMGGFPDVTKYTVIGMVAQGAGPTPLIAAMRAYVASKFGDEVPDVTDLSGSVGRSPRDGNI